MKEALTFKIDGEWLTNFVRTRYWYEGLSYQEAFDLCKSILVPYGTEPDEQFTNVINGILTGTMKLEGVNSFDVMEDNKFSEFTKYLGRLELAKRKPEFKGHLRLHPENYIDPASTKNSAKIIEEKEGHKVIRKEIIQFDAENLHPFKCYDGDVEEYWAVPDPDFTSDLGLISPQGDFYGCTFASHLFLAQHLIERDPAMHKEFLAKYGNRILAEDRSLDFLLLDKGWIAIRNACGGVGRIDLGKYSSEDELPQRMLDAVWDYRVRRREDK